jgi:uncharacterized RDD family membrane protein YckC
MFCTRCGTNLPQGAAFCPSCGSPVTTGGEAPAPGPAPPTPATTVLPATGPPALPRGATPAYSGFWRRFWAYLLDRFILGIVHTPLSLVVFSPVLGDRPLDWEDSYAAYAVADFVNALFTFVFFVLVANWLYYALLHSSPKQATLGQMALEIRVTDLQGRRVTFARATGRYFASVLTGLTFFIGYLIMLLNEKRQTLHDLIAGTVVIR